MTENQFNRALLIYSDLKDLERELSKLRAIRGEINKNPSNIIKLYFKGHTDVPLDGTEQTAIHSILSILINSKIIKIKKLKSLLEAI